jgi:nucleotide-binding universal stress UspA family protein
MKILLAVDGSACSRRAVKYVCRHFAELGTRSRLTLVNADPALPPGVTRHLGAADVAAYHRENADWALRAARADLAKAQIAFKEAVLVGPVAEAIVEFAREGRFQLVVMGSHGYGALKGLLLGSVVTKVLARAATPVLVVR